MEARTGSSHTLTQKKFKKCTNWQMDNLIDRYNESTRTLSGKNKPNPDNNNGTFHSPPPPKQTPNHVSFSQQLPLLLMWGVGENSRVNASCDQKSLSLSYSSFLPPNTWSSSCTDRDCATRQWMKSRVRGKWLCMCVCVHVYRGVEGCVNLH